MKLYVRTEANQITATGHMMRCLAIADAAKEMGVETVFIVAEKVSETLPLKKGYQVICLNRKWDDFDTEIPVMEQLIEQHHIEVILVDSYFVSERYMEALHKKVRTAYIDDLHAGIWPCSVIINYAVYSDLFDYEKEYPDAEKLLGCNYTPLRKEYRGGFQRKIREKVQEVLVVTGGTDAFHFMRQFLEAVKENRNWDEIHFTLVCGSYNEDLDVLKQLGHETENVTILEALPSLKSAMAEADFIVTAGGTTLYEVAAMQLPGICFCIADNQILNIEGFTKKGMLAYGGDVRKDFSMEQLGRILEEYRNNKEKREKMSERLGQLLDGNGACRMAAALLKMERK